MYKTQFYPRAKFKRTRAAAFAEWRQSLTTQKFLRKAMKRYQIFGSPKRTATKEFLARALK